MIHVSPSKWRCAALCCFRPLAPAAMVGVMGFPKGHWGKGHKLGQNPVLSEKAGSEIFSPNPLRAITGLNVKLA